MKYNPLLNVELVLTFIEDFNISIDDRQKAYDILMLLLNEQYSNGFQDGLDVP